MKLLKYFTPFEYLLFSLSAITIIISYIAFGGNAPTLAASLIGISALILCAKGNPIGQALIIIFSILYGYISYSFSYYGEMITYLGMSTPMAAFALISWLKNPAEKGHAEVKVSSLEKSDIILSFVLAAAVAVLFCPVLYLLNTSNLLFSTISVGTSFSAVYLTARRSPYYALAYAANDAVLIVLWVYAALSSTMYIGAVVCFTAFLINDIYGFASWMKMKKRQSESAPAADVINEQ